MLSRFIRVVTIVLSAALLVGACGGGSSKQVAAKPVAPGTAAPFPDSCALVTKEEVSAVLGHPVTKTRKVENGICMFETDSLSDPWIGTEIRDDKATLGSFNGYIESIKGNGSAYPVAGIGDAASYVDLSVEGFRTIALYVLKGKMHFAIGNLENLKGQEGLTQPLPAVRKLALQAIARMP